MSQEFPDVSRGVDGYGFQADVCSKRMHEVEDVSVGSRRVDEREKEPDQTQSQLSDLDLLERPLDQMQVIGDPMQENVKGYRRQWRGEAMGPGFTMAAESVPSICLSPDKMPSCIYCVHGSVTHLSTHGIQENLFGSGG